MVPKMRSQATVGATGLVADKEQAAFAHRA
jgi:hypothetical protein